MCAVRGKNSPDDISVVDEETAFLQRELLMKYKELQSIQKKNSHAELLLKATNEKIKHATQQLRLLEQVYLGKKRRRELESEQMQLILLEIKSCERNEKATVQGILKAQERMKKYEIAKLEATAELLKDVICSHENNGKSWLEIYMTYEDEILTEEYSCQEEARKIEALQQSSEKLALEWTRKKEAAERINTETKVAWMETTSIMKECRELFSKKLHKLDAWNNVVSLCVEKAAYLEDLQKELEAVRTQLQRQSQDMMAAREELHFVHRSLRDANGERRRLEQLLATLRCESEHDSSAAQNLAGEVAILERAVQKTGNLLQQRQNANIIRLPLIQSQLQSIQLARKVATRESLTMTPLPTTPEDALHSEIERLENRKEKLLQMLQRRRQKIAATREMLMLLRQKQECLATELQEVESNTQNAYLLLYNQNKVEQQQNDTIQELQSAIWDTERRLEQTETKNTGGHLSFIQRNLSERLVRVRASRLALHHQLRTAKAMEEKKRQARKGLSIEDTLKDLQAEIAQLERQSCRLKARKQEFEEKDRDIQLQVMQRQHLIQQESHNASLLQSSVMQFEKEMRERRREADAQVHAARRERVQSEHMKSVAARRYKERARRVTILQARYESIVRARGLCTDETLPAAACLEDMAEQSPPTVITQEMEQLRNRAIKLQDAVDMAKAKLEKTTHEVAIAQNALSDMRGAFTTSPDPDQDITLQDLETKKLDLQRKLDSADRTIASTQRAISQLKQLFPESHNEELEQEVKALLDMSKSLSHDLSQITTKQVRALAQKMSKLRLLGTGCEQLALRLEALQELQRRVDDRIAELAQEASVRVALRDICMQEKVQLSALEQRPRALRERLVKAQDVKIKKHITIASPIAKINLGADIPDRE
ncbi:uncharacterized protein LOC135394278 isoform X2 [Ornithodoros turicata]|uniref:uncharacterized protein LOC135394278 isoform X2 n=1 Tax=Ornithodoros turicata TaxID=34597 RepID=UPI0031391B60